MNEVNEPLEAAHSALEVGQPEEALECVQALPADDPERRLVECLAYLDLGRPADARAAFEGAATLLDEDDPWRLWAEAELLLSEWRVTDARAVFERLAQVERNLAVLDRLALCADLEEDHGAADELLAEAARLDPEACPLPTRLAADEFQVLVQEAVQELPPAYRAKLELARVITEPMPFADLVLPEDPGATPPDLLGLFVGPTIHDLAEDASATLPPTIYLFQRNLERRAPDREELRGEIHVTLFHELGHLLGLDEEGVDALGLG